MSPLLLLLAAPLLVFGQAAWAGGGQRGRSVRRARPVRPTRVAVVGAGNYGTCLAQRLALNGHKVSLWAHEGDVVAGIRRNGTNPRFLQGVPLSDRISPHGSLKRTLKGKKIVVVAVPSEHLASVAKQMRPYLDRDAIVVSATKGLSSKGGFATMTEVLAKAFKGRVDKRRLVAFSGPGFAVEIGERKPTLVTIASKDREITKTVRRLFDTGGSFSVETTRDVAGVQFWGAAKNPLAIVSGVLEGLGVDRRTRKAVLGQAIAELATLAKRHGVSESSFSTAAALGDIVLTSSSGSRNYRLGRDLGAGQTPQQILAKMNGQVAEGVSNAAAFQQLGQRYRLSMPVFDALTAVVSGDKPATSLVGLARQPSGSATTKVAKITRAKASVWRRGVAAIETFAGLGAGLGLSYNPRAKLMMGITRDIERLAAKSRDGSLLGAPDLAASVVLTNSSAAGSAYKSGHALGAGKLGSTQRAALRRQVGSLLADARRLGVSTPALQALDSALARSNQLGRPDHSGQGGQLGQLGQLLAGP